MHRDLAWSKVRHCIGRILIDFTASLVERCRWMDKEENKWAWF